MRNLIGVVVKILLVLGVLAAVGFVLVILQLQASYPAPHAIPAPVVWTSEPIVLTPEQPAVHGRLSFGGGTIPTGTLRVGLNAGVPSGSTASLAPGAILSGPLVRLSTTIGGVPGSCLAPCELAVSPDFECDSGDCRMEVSLTVELEGADPSSRDAVSVTIAGGASAGPAAQFGQGFTVQLLFDTTATTGAEPT